MTTTLFRGGRVFDGTGSEPFPADVLVDGERIAAVRPRAESDGDADASAPRADEVVDITGSVLMPGLIDAHVHAQFDGMDLTRVQNEPFSMQFFESARNLGRMLDAGVTTARDGGGADLGVRTAIEQGYIEGPRLLIAITALSQTGGHVDGWNVHGDHQRLMVPHPGRPDSVVDGVEGMRLRVRELIRAGADHIKVCASGGIMSTRDVPRHPQFSFEELRMCVVAAADAGRPVMAHAQAAAGVKRALRAGVRSIEHGVFLDDESIELFLETGAWLVPTLMAPVSLVEAIDAGMRVTPEIDAKARGVAEIHLESVRRAHAAGVKIALGTDSGVFAHGAHAKELGWLVEAGMTPFEALAAGTSGAAELLGLEDRVGRVAEGFAADLLVLDGDAADVARFDERLRLVVQAGRVVRDRR